MPNCPCCSDMLLRHIQDGSIYWFCRSCWQEMPVLNQKFVKRKVPSYILAPAEVFHRFESRLKPYRYL